MRAKNEIQKVENLDVMGQNGCYFQNQHMSSVFQNQHNVAKNNNKSRNWSLTRRLSPLALQPWLERLYAPHDVIATSFNQLRSL